MSRILIVLVVLGGSSFGISRRALASTPAQLAASYLQTKQGFDGSFGGATGTEPTYTTAVAVQALALVLGSNSTSVEQARLYLSGRRPIAVDLQARRLQALDGTSLSDPLTASLFRSAAQSGSGFGFLGTDSAPTLLESAQVLGFIAGDALLTAATAPPQINLQPVSGCSQTSVFCSAISAQLQFILSAQNSDGGWAYSGESSDVRLTAEIAAVLMPLRHQLSIDAQLTSAVSFLLAQQAGDGHFGTASPSTADTAMAAIALVGAPTTQSTAANKAITFLTGSQKADGSWDESELDTALAANALMAVLPSLQVNPTVQGSSGSLSLSTDNPSADGTVTASVTITNSGDNASAATTVTFTAVGEDGQPTVTLGTANVGALDAGTSSTVTDALSTSGLTGAYQIVATVTSVATPPPVSASEGSTGTAIYVTTNYDLGLTSSDIQFSILDAGGVLDAGVATITATIHEYGAVEPASFNVGFYEGDPRAGGTLIGESGIAWIDAGAVASAAMNWAVSQGNGLTPIFVVADPEGRIPDSNQANNIASQIYQAPVVAVDLFVVTAGIQFVPSIAAPGQPVTVDAYVFNNSTTDVFNVQVGFCPSLVNDGNGTLSLSCPTQIVTLPVVPAMLSAIATFTLPGTFTVLPNNRTSNQVYVAVTVDPFNLLSDPQTTNNTATNYVLVANDAAFSVRAFTPAPPAYGPVVAGTSVSFRPSITSNSPNLLRIPWTLYIGDPNLGGVASQSGVQEVGAGGGATLNINAVTTGPTTLFVWSSTPRTLFITQLRSRLAPIAPTRASEPTWESVTTMSAFRPPAPQSGRRAR